MCIIFWSLEHLLCYGLLPEKLRIGLLKKVKHFNPLPLISHIQARTATVYRVSHIELKNELLLKNADIQLLTTQKLKLGRSTKLLKIQRHCLSALDFYLEFYSKVVKQLVYCEVKSCMFKKKKKSIINVS